MADISTPIRQWLPLLAIFLLLLGNVLGLAHILLDSHALSNASNYLRDNGQSIENNYFSSTQAVLNAISSSNGHLWILSTLIFLGMPLMLANSIVLKIQKQYFPINIVLLTISAVNSLRISILSIGLVFI